jgi:hypothetical protein
LYGSQNKQRLLPYKTLRDWFFITEVESVYSAVRTESLYKPDTLPLQRVNCKNVFGEQIDLLSHAVNQYCSVSKLMGRIYGR